ncbi:hypothetical protein AVEN_273573-1 [Araneus ventricosus]|uniref:Uncharacterized protein n=1 Tax=Araneus ventricosus TaxID=182803 RepID=A0A4Y2X4W6_ARAVE|nr:hypothetical protein AVEN_273573-1 [Araneus ventricosus]
MRSRQIGKRGFASLMGIIMIGACHLLVIARTSFGRGWAVAGDGHYDSGLALDTGRLRLGRSVFDMKTNCGSCEKMFRSFSKNVPDSQRTSSSPMPQKSIS